MLRLHSFWKHSTYKAPYHYHHSANPRSLSECSKSTPRIQLTPTPLLELKRLNHLWLENSFLEGRLCPERATREAEPLPPWMPKQGRTPQRIVLPQNMGVWPWAANPAEATQSTCVGPFGSQCWQLSVGSSPVVLCRAAISAKVRRSLHLPRMEAWKASY